MSIALDDEGGAVTTTSCVAVVLLGWMFVLSCESDRDAARHRADAHDALIAAGVDSSAAEGNPLPRMHATRIPDSEPGPIEHVKGFRVFQAGDCTVWRFTDSVGVHYLAEGRHSTYSTAGVAVACAVAR